MKTNTTNKINKADIFNLIILDESGSMFGVRKQTISGCNETIETIKNAQAKYAETQNHYLSIYVFQGGGATPSRYLVKNVPAHAAEPISESDYQPNGNTPLFDAVGSTLVDLKSSVVGKEKAIGSVTIITDGYENSSRHYTLQKVRNMISQLKEMGWNFNFIGANIDVEQYATMFNIDNSMKFDQTEDGTKRMFSKLNKCRSAYMQRIDDVMLSIPEDGDSFCGNLKDAAKDFFKGDEE